MTSEVIFLRGSGGVDLRAGLVRARLPRTGRARFRAEADAQVERIGAKAGIR